jgi:hypothetical protein
MAGDIYLTDTTVYVLQGRYPQVRRRFAALLSEGRLTVCQMTALEYLNNAASPSSYESVWGALHEQRWIDVTTEAMDRALAAPLTTKWNLLAVPGTSWRV